MSGLALIGTGRWGRVLAAALNRVPELELLTCYSRGEESRRAFAADFGCMDVGSFEDAISHPGVEGVLLVTPNHVHADQAIACAQRGRHIFIEKPIADSLSDGRAIAQACHEAGVILMVGHAFRRLGAARRVKRAIDEGLLGQVVLAEANFSLPGGLLKPGQWRYYRETCPGGPLMQLGVHHADTLQYWLGPVARVQGSFAHLATSAEIDDVGVALLEFGSGVRGVLTGSYVSPHTYFLRLFGSQATLTYETDMTVWPRAAEMDPATTLTLQTRNGREVLSFETRDMLAEELAEFGRCIRDQAEPETGAAEGLRALAVIRGTLASNERGMAVPINEADVA